MSSRRSMVLTLVVFPVLFLFGHLKAADAGPPPITGSPSIERPKLLAWPKDLPNITPNLTERTANRTYDLHASFGECDLVLSTAGNYHMALGEFWHTYVLPEAARRGIAITNWFYTTSPPISPDQIANGHMMTGNFRSQCRPQVAVGPRSLVNELLARGFITKDQEVPIIQNKGNVILVRKGNPKLIQSIWDLARDDVRVVTSHPTNEPGSFGNYSNSIYNIAYQDELNKKAPTGWDAYGLFNAIFNNTWVANKWLSGRRIHHREVPYSLAFGRADAGLMFYHLALHAKCTFPNRFDMVPLGGTVDNPAPKAGNKVGTLYAVRINGNWNHKQEAAQNLLMDMLEKSHAFTDILCRHGLKRPNEECTVPCERCTTCPFQ